MTMLEKMFLCGKDGVCLARRKSAYKPILAFSVVPNYSFISASYTWEETA